MNPEIDTILADFANTARDALGHVGFANYRERQTEAYNWVAVAHNEARRKLQLLFGKEGQ